MQNHFNLIDEPWIPVVDMGRVGLREIFENGNLRHLGGNPIQKLAVFKLLLAIAQAAITPKTNQEWLELGASGMACKCLNYLDKWHESFYLYGPTPFLQMPQVKKAHALSYGNFLPEVSTGNTTVLTQSQIEHAVPDADRALILIQQMGFSLAGKKTDNSLVLSSGYAGKQNDRGRPSSGRAGPSVGHLGFLHHFVLLQSLRDSIWLNLLTEEDVEQTRLFKNGVGQAPWELMPSGEDCAVARYFKNTYMGRLIPLSRFCLLQEEGMHYTEGLAHDNYREGIQDLSIAIDSTGKQPRALWANPEKRPWRELNSLLSFLSQTGPTGFQCWQLFFTVPRATNHFDVFSVWSAGLKVSSTAGEQYVSGSDDFVESWVWIASYLIGEIWFEQLKIEMSELERLAKSLYASVNAYFNELTTDGVKFAQQATGLFWQFCERNFQSLIESCDDSEQSKRDRYQNRQQIVRYLNEAYDYFCPKDTARQLDAWAKSRPYIGKYLVLEEHV